MKRRRIRIADRRRYTAANDSGDGPATVVSRETPASKEADEDDGFDLPEDQFGEVASAIEREFQGRLADIRNLPRRDRPAARRAAADWRREMLKVLAEKRLAARRAQIADRRRLRALKRAASRDQPKP
jgi:hypothetical protein